MNLVQDEIIYPEQSYSEYQRSDDPIPEISEPESQDPLEVPLKPGQRYGWWENHEHGDMHGHGWIGDDTWSWERLQNQNLIGHCIMSLDLARRLKLKLRTHRQIKVSGLGGVTTYITTHARVKTTLGWSMVYVLNIWVGSIGEGVDVLLGMNFMHSAGVRLCIREGLVKLPDEETVVMYDNDPKSRGMDLPVCPEESIHLRPGQDAMVRIRYGQSNHQQEKTSDQDPVLCRSWETAVKVVNVSDQNVWIDTRTAVARIMEYGQFPGQPGFARPGKARYEEWQQLIHECTVSRQARMRAERLEQILREREPPCTQTQGYQWTTKLLEKPKPLDMTLKIIGNSSVVVNTVARDPEEPETRSEPAEQTHPDLSPEVETRDPESMADVGNDAQVPEPSVDVQSQTSCSTPVQRLEAGYARVMRFSAEELDLEPAVHLREGDLMAQLRDQLIMLPKTEEPTPECNIDEANVGVPGRDPETPSQPAPENLAEPADPPELLLLDRLMARAKDTDFTQDTEDPVPTSREEDDEVSEEEESDQDEIEEPPSIIEDEDEASSTQII
ncbi:hypothetical protein PHMEG_00016487 [Phytophthora megakarya]|uniref:Aspartic protease n=1 Tax=Phytophthora megakarya TaxID=4795 RepID=A0A225W0V1_9STRA|nr:hypothetical protein PHMEG_00016487 [Phytophthora megakarya]